MKKTLLIAITVLFLDAYLFNQGVLSLVFLLLVVPVQFIRALISFRNKEAMKQKFASAGIYLAMAVMALLYIHANNSMAERRANELIAACEQYHSAHGIYPETLGDLVPDYIKKIPKAKYAYANNQFLYIAHEDSHTLLYTSFPPFGRQLYRFELKRWGSQD